MSEIQRSGKWNPGGGRWLELLPAAGVASYARNGFSAPTITIRSGFAWTRIYCTPGTLSFNQDEQTTDNGRTYEIDIKGFSPDDWTNKAIAFDNVVKYDRMLARFCDNDGLVRVIGSPVENLMFSFQLSTDADVPGQRGYALQLKGVMTQPATYE